MYDFPLHDCAQEQNGSPYVCFIFRQSKWPSLSRKIVEIQKFRTMVTRRHTSLRKANWVLFREEERGNGVVPKAQIWKQSNSQLMT